MRAGSKSRKCSFGCWVHKIDHSPRFKDEELVVRPRAPAVGNGRPGPSGGGESLLQDQELITGAGLRPLPEPVTLLGKRRNIPE